MPQAARTTDPISPHSPCTPGKCGPGSSDVLIENLQAYRVGDKTEPHGRKITGACVPHVTPLVNGSHNVFINGQPAGRVGDTHSCGIIVLSGSSKVSINGGGTGSVTPSPNHHPPKQEFSSVSDNLTDYIKSKEKFNETAFWDYKQYTNGYGTKALSSTETITEEEALRRLNKDLATRRAYVSRWSDDYNYDWSPDQIDALTSFVFNIGSLDGVTANGTRTDTQIAAKMLDYNKATVNGVLQPLTGLTQRRTEESNWFKRGMN